MARVLLIDWTEMGTRYLDRVRAEGIVVSDHGTPTTIHGFARRDGTLHSYVSRKTGAEVWVVEVEGFDPPDAQWWSATVLDARPSAAAIDVLTRGRAVAVGDELESA